MQFYVLGPNGEPMKESRKLAYEEFLRARFKRFVLRTELIDQGARIWTCFCPWSVDLADPPAFLTHILAPRLDEIFAPATQEEAQDKHRPSRALKSQSLNSSGPLRILAEDQWDPYASLAPTAPQPVPPACNISDVITNDPSHASHPHLFIHIQINNTAGRDNPTKFRCLNRKKWLRKNASPQRNCQRPN